MAGENDIPLQRNAVAELYGDADNPHPGLLLARGTATWKADKNAKGEAFQKQVGKVAGLRPSPVYQAAYTRWESIVSETPEIAPWAGRLDGRLFIGLGGPSVIETAITLSRAYGIPIIPGSAQKGLARAYGAAVGLDEPQLAILFGRGDAVGDTGSGGTESGYVVFHDAWWLPESAPTPLTPEIVTVHHDGYYESNGRSAATDFDSPVPNAQIAARGGFLFAAECGAPAWSEFAIDLLSRALMAWGIGGKTAAGYGRFEPIDAINKRFNQAQRDAKIKLLPPEQRLRKQVEDLALDKLPELLGKSRNKTKAAYGDDWDAFLDLVGEIHAAAIRPWQDSSKKNEKKAYNTVFNRNNSS